MSTATMLQQFEILERKYRDQGRDLVRVKDELNAEHGEFSTHLALISSQDAHLPHCACADQS